MKRHVIGKVFSYIFDLNMDLKSFCITSIQSRRLQTKLGESSSGKIFSSGVLQFLSAIGQPVPINERSERVEKGVLPLCV